MNRERLLGLRTNMVSSLGLTLGDLEQSLPDELYLDLDRFVNLDLEDLLDLDLPLVDLLLAPQFAGPLGMRATAAAEPGLATFMLSPSQQIDLFFPYSRYREDTALEPLCVLRSRLPGWSRAAAGSELHCPRPAVLNRATLLRSSLTCNLASPTMLSDTCL